jgi:phosphatidate phosphatase LPIN
MTLRSTDPDISRYDTDISSPIPTEDLLEERDSRRYDRAKSEPPVDSLDPISPTLDPSKTAMAMDYAWDWGRLPIEGDLESRQDMPERRESLPPVDTESSETAPSTGDARLRNVEENPYLFVLDAKRRSHTFELSLSGDSILDIDGTSDPELKKESFFLDHRVTFQKFIESPRIVDDPRLVVRYSLQ